MEFSQFLSEVCRRSDSQLTAIERCYTHWQIWHNGKCLVDVWPTTNKYREANLKPGSPARAGNPYTAINRAIELIGLVKKSTAEPSGTCKIVLSVAYLNELKSKVEHGYNLLNEEARHLFAHAGILIPKHERCKRCNNDGVVTEPGTTSTMPCPECQSSSKPTERQQMKETIPKLKWTWDYEGRWTAYSAIADSEGNSERWVIDTTEVGLFTVDVSTLDTDTEDFRSLGEAKVYCETVEHQLLGRLHAGDPDKSNKESLLASAYELLRAVTTSAMGGVPVNCLPAIPRGMQLDYERTPWHTWDRLVNQLLKEINDVI